MSTASLWDSLGFNPFCKTALISLSFHCNISILCCSHLGQRAFEDNAELIGQSCPAGESLGDGDVIFRRDVLNQEASMRIRFVERQLDSFLLPVTLR